jgi:hypothetical protein
MSSRTWWTCCEAYYYCYEELADCCKYPGSWVFTVLARNTSFGTVSPPGGEGYIPGDRSQPLRDCRRWSSMTRRRTSFPHPKAYNKFRHLQQARPSLHGWFKMLPLTAIRGFMSAQFDHSLSISEARRLQMF